MTPPTRTTLAVLVVAGTLGAAAAPLSAHDLGQGQVIAGFVRDPAGALEYTIEVAVDPSSIAARLGLPGAASTADWCPAFARRVRIDFDGTPSTPACEYVPMQPAARGSAGTVARMRLTGVAPPSSSSFTWSCDLLYGSYPLAVQTGDGPAVTEWLQGSQTSAPVGLEARGAQLGSMARHYLRLGFTHILPGGLDHVLFVAALFVSGAGRRSTLVQVTAFTIAHSMALALTRGGWMAAPVSIVEPLFPLSIVYVAVENLTTREASRRRVAVVFAFGLLHGMGAAGLPGDPGLTREAFAVAFAAFNAGLEAGQLAVIALLALAVAIRWRHERWYRRRVVVPASIAIALTGVYWTLVRTI